MRTTPLIAAICLSGLVGCGEATSADGQIGQRVAAGLIDGTGARIGEVTAWQGADGVLLQVRVEKLPPGLHGLHLHAVGDCSDIGVFTASGGHIEGAGGAHGFLHPDGTHGGDLPNLYAHQDGVAVADFFTTRVMLSDVLDEDGSALIVHANPDDYRTQPIGGAGARIACAAFTGKQ